MRDRRRLGPIRRARINAAPIHGQTASIQVLVTKPLAQLRSHALWTQESGLDFNLKYLRTSVSRNNWTRRYTCVYKVTDNNFDASNVSHSQSPRPAELGAGSHQSPATLRINGIVQRRPRSLSHHLSVLRSQKLVALGVARDTFNPLNTPFCLNLSRLIARPRLSSPTPHQSPAITGHAVPLRCPFWR
jgi:hypothetical protein